MRLLSRRLPAWFERWNKSERECGEMAKYENLPHVYKVLGAAPRRQRTIE